MGVSNDDVEELLDEQEMRDNEEIFKQIDKNQDNKLSAGEILAFMVYEKSDGDTMDEDDKFHEARIVDHFEKSDADGNEFLSLSEFHILTTSIDADDEL